LGVAALALLHDLELQGSRGVLALGVGGAEEDVGGGTLDEAGRVADDGRAGSSVDGGASARGDAGIVLHHHG
jgi:hypothetical protein